jgi:glycosyltransferase involved in cell wall biosynthesis
MKTVAILSDFYSADPTYSLNIVIEEQLGMLAAAGYKPVAIAEDIFKPVRAWKLAEMRAIPSGIKRGNSITFHEGWEDDVAKIRASLDVALDGVDVVLTHDMIYQAATLWINMAARQYAKDHPNVTWLNWVHSATPSPVWHQRDERLASVQVHFPHSKTVFPNDYDVPRVARNFRCGMDDVAVVPHPTDVCGYLGFLDITKKLVQEKDLLSADAILVYPVRLDRGKQVEYVIHTASAIKKLGRSVRVVVADFHSTAGDKVEYRKWLKNYAIDQGLNSVEMTFTSEFDESLKTRCPRQMIRDLMSISSLFVLSSKSETYSLITQEAGLCGALLVLNADFPVLRSIYGSKALYYPFSSNIDKLTGMDGETTTNYSDIDGFFRDIALRAIYEMENSKVLAQRIRIRKERNPQRVFQKYIEPLFYCFD